MQDDPEDYRIGRGAPWLERAIDELRYSQKHVHAQGEDVKLAVRMLRMLEIENIPGPVIFSSRGRGVCIEWLCHEPDAVKDFSIRVFQKSVFLRAT